MNYHSTSAGTAIATATGNESCLQIATHNWTLGIFRYYIFKKQKNEGKINTHESKNHHPTIGPSISAAARAIENVGIVFKFANNSIAITSSSVSSSMANPSFTHRRTVTTTTSIIINHYTLPQSLLTATLPRPRHGPRRRKLRSGISLRRGQKGRTHHPPRPFLLRRIAH